MIKIKAYLLVLCILIIYVSCDPNKYNSVDYPAYGTGLFLTKASDISIQNSKSSHINWFTVVVTYFQLNINTTSIGFLQGVSSTDAEVIHAIQQARANGFNVALKPHVDLTNDTAHWRGEIGTYFDSAEWKAWFQSYDEYITHMASIAKQNGVKLFVIGTELSTTEAQESYWRNTIKNVRTIFSDKIVYGSNWDIAKGAHTVNFWDALDYIGVDAYFPVANQVSPTVNQIVQGWQVWVSFLENLSVKWQKQVMFPEIGYQSLDDTAMTPWNSNGKLDPHAQANAYEGFFQAVYPQPWFIGAFWWAWDTDPALGGKCDTSFTPYDKPAEDVMRKYYRVAKKPNIEASLIIYANGTLQKDWNNQSWGGQVNLQSPIAPYQKHTYSLQAQLQGWGAVVLGTKTLENTSPYSYLSFAIKLLPRQTQNLFVSFSGANGTLEGPGVQVSRYTDNCILPTSWTKITIPLAALLAEDTTIDSIKFYNYQSSANTFWLDEIVLNDKI